MARNKDRTSAPKVEHDEAPPAPAATQAQEFSWSNPTEFVDLPSGGKFYPEGHPLHGQDTLEIRFMTAKEEDILTSRSLLKSGMALNRLVDSLVLDKRIRSTDLLIGDRNAILVAARVTGYGDEYEVKMVCPSCGEAEEISYSIDRITHFKEQDSDSHDVSQGSANGLYLTTLPKSGFPVEFKLLTAGDEMKMAKQRDQKKKHKLGETQSTDLLRAILVRVNGSTQPIDLARAVELMPALDARHLRKVYKQVNPDIVLSDYYVCNSCGHDEEMEIPLSAEFFWPE